MDRFIGEGDQALEVSVKPLKSNMDRFIEIVHILTMINKIL